MDSNVMLDAMVIFLVELGKSEPEASALCNVAATILLAITKEGAKTSGEALDVLHDYHLQAKQYKALHSKYEVAGKPFLKDGVWHCPSCNRRTTPNHSYCHCCGKRLGWR